MHPSIFSFRCVNVEVAVPSVPILSSQNKTLRSWEVGGKAGGKTWIPYRSPTHVSGQIVTWVFPNIGVPQNGWFVMENPIKMDDLGVPLFSETSTYHQSWRWLKWGDVPKPRLHYGGPRSREVTIIEPDVCLVIILVFFFWHLFICATSATRSGCHLNRA